jgi:hypothetical protein
MKQRSIALLGLAIAVITLLAGFSYFLCQQLQRQDANDPQIQIAEDAAAAFSSGQPVPTMDQAGSQIDIAKSLSTFIIIYNATGTAVFSTGQLNNAVPIPPKSIFDWVKARGEDRVTWQPTTGVRLAAVLTPYSSSGESGTVLVGRSLREVEKRDTMLLMQFAIAWAILMILAVLGAIFISVFPFGSSPMKFKHDRPVPPIRPEPRPEARHQEPHQEPHHDLHHEPHHDLHAHPASMHEHSHQISHEHQHQDHENHVNSPQI